MPISSIFSGVMFLYDLSHYMEQNFYTYIGFLRECLVLEKGQNVELRNFMWGKCSVMA